LVPAFHREVFASTSDDRIIVNIGGISNVTLLKKDHDAVTGFDTGPGNVLMDLWVHKHKQQAFDDNGTWADSGTLDNELLQNLLNDGYFHLPPPKSTGRELFNWQWLNTKLEGFSHLAPQDVQATLVELTTSTICDSISSLLSSGELIVCGGGARNGQIILSLKKKLEKFNVSTSSDHGLNSDSVEAVAFAWLAKQAIEGKAVDYTRITGASHPIIMGGIYYSE
jgi:anhydro-N-acetylmuramic acid kinase